MSSFRHIAVDMPEKVQEMKVYETGKDDKKA